MRTLDANPELEAYLRLNNAAYAEWRVAIAQLLACPGVEGRLPRPQAVVGSLSALTVDAGIVCVLDMAQDMELVGCCVSQPLLVTAVQGRGEITLQGGSRLPVFPLAVIPAGRKFTLRIAECSRLVLVYPVSEAVPAGPRPGLEVALAGHIHRFLMRSDYFQDHQDASGETQALFDRLERQLVSGQVDLPEDLPVLDRRLVRVIEKIRSERDWEFDLQDLARHCGASERNLYYLMKRETGMTPYRFYQRCRLIRVRKRLVDCKCDVPHISWYAADEGFSHLGRFAALYREHFGELPSETVQWRRRLQQESLAEPARRAMI
ncbi:MAG: helix-turn-helix domain-containing protein [Marinobacter sp.]|uniref:AraC family transcriptional regulator n=1 Tax=Marinobacter sp. TaxID=50741 RepID=UPI0029C415E6|nr:helix-turn-helix domain-containing protein [Marinobacter sp.]MDX5334874.1 helix-turn-helix domain-containing protein [Marinobacter sp.]MDX5385536.1 helix-turn-helix domain-containing protein [Marinobacter sp.]MDX5440921.1 helix-turn-helix domain-containing protein [Alteromonadaceae bacterium]MDX5471163.1 helix-turn-helix domain-containing protein [Marinobacter sp.]